MQTKQSPVINVTSFQLITAVEEGNFAFVGEKYQNTFWNANIVGWNSSIKESVALGSVSGAIKYKGDIVTIALNGIGIENINIASTTYTSYVKWDYNLIVFF